MTLYETLSADVKEAMKARDSKRRDALRLVFSDLKTMLIDIKVEDLEEGADANVAKAQTLGDEGEIKFLSTQAKRRRDSIQSYEEAGRDELAEQEKYELALIESYLPKQLTEDEARDVVREVIAEVGATSKKQFGQVMGKAMAKLKGRFPGGQVKGIVQGLLD